MGLIDMQHVFIIGSRGLPANYGGFETFVEELVSQRKSDKICYHVACLSDTKHKRHDTYLGVDCFFINPPQVGAARVILYDMMAIGYALDYCQQHHISQPIVYVLGNTIGAFIKPFAKKIHQMQGKLFVNPDGLEWKRAKWSKPVQRYLKYAEKQMTKAADMIISDNQGIADYIQKAYPWSQTTFIAYGTDLTQSSLTAQSDQVRSYFQKHGITEKGYYLVVGRFVPENNYETLIREFMASDTSRDLVLICNYQGNPYVTELKHATGFTQDARIKFVGTVYDKALLSYIRQNAFAYIHGHEVGGTNPGLLEALAHTDLNLVLDVPFNQSVAQKTALYWTKKNQELAQLIDSVDKQETFEDLGKQAKQHMAQTYTWEKIVAAYEALFLDEN